MKLESPVIQCTDFSKSSTNKIEYVLLLVLIGEPYLNGAEQFGLQLYSKTVLFSFFQLISPDFFLKYL